MSWPHPPSASRPGPLARLLGALLVMLPAATLAFAAAGAAGLPQTVLAVGGTAAAFVGVCLVYQLGAGRAARGANVLPLYLAADLLLWYVWRREPDPERHVLLPLLVAVPLVLMLAEAFAGEGGGSRQARGLVRRIARRSDWPRGPDAVRSLPEVKALRAALRDDAGPALVLLLHPRWQVRLAALAALEFRREWRPGQPQTVLQAAHFATEACVRAAAVAALANVPLASVIDGLVPYLRDPAREVRASAAEALLWDARTRWPRVRRDVHAALADPRLIDDGGMACSGGLPSPAVNDLLVWAGETGAVGRRATLTRCSITSASRCGTTRPATPRRAWPS